ncbi:MAG: peptidoglycan DD-metalloendopeptidase family protein [Thiolinea sp.]
MRTAIALSLALSFCHTSTVLADTASDKRKVQREIKQLNQQIDQKEAESDSLSSQVTKLEKELGELTRQQHSTEQKIKDAQLRIASADNRTEELNQELQQQQAALAQQLQAMHTAGEQSHLRLLLLQDNPSDISRSIEYFNYLNRYRSKKIKQIGTTRDELETVKAAAKKERLDLKQLQDQLVGQKQAVGQKLDSRADALKLVQSDLSGKQRRLQKLKTQEENLQKEIDRLARIAEQKRQAREAEARAREQAKQREQQRVAASRSPQTSKTQPATPSTPARTVTTSRTPNKPFSTLRGKMSWPVSGKVIHTYGSRKNEKQNWKGMVITAAGGTAVKAVAQGKVVFADWMNGYGHLIILEHDGGYISLYGYNRAVFKRVGQYVRANETIAAVGNSSGQAQNALYFEIRRKTVPQNPARWLR